MLDGDTARKAASYRGKVVTNPSGGLLSKGHALQHNLGLGGACVVTLYNVA